MAPHALPRSIRCSPEALFVLERGCGLKADSLCRGCHRKVAGLSLTNASCGLQWWSVHPVPCVASHWRISGGRSTRSTVWRWAQRNIRTVRRGLSVVTCMCWIWESWIPEEKRTESVPGTRGARDALQPVLCVHYQSAATQPAHPSDRGAGIAAQPLARLQPSASSCTASGLDRAFSSNRHCPALFRIKRARSTVCKAAHKTGP